MDMAENATSACLLEIAPSIPCQSYAVIFNVQPREKVAAYDRLGIGGIIRMNAFDGSGREVFARGK